MLGVGQPALIPLPLNKRLHVHFGFSSALDGERHLSSFAVRRFCSHISGLERFFGRKVLEIGGSDRISMEDFFVKGGADYLNVRLESNKKKNPRVMVADFMDVKGEFDLVISLGVFELGAIDIDFDTSRPLKNGYSIPGRINKLFSLCKEGSHAVIGTINAPCLFDNKAIRGAGFEILHRESPFYTFMFAANDGVYAPGDRSELLILRKR